jgi:transcriptional regulator with XRE-family HTH domain
MQSGRILAGARRRAGLTQRELAARAGLPASTVARIESCRVDPRFGTLMALLRECGETLSVGIRGSAGIDMGQIRARLALDPADRLRVSVAAINNVRAMLGSRSES